MSRLIDADALIAYCDEHWIPINVDAINAQPTVEERKKGKWIHDGYDFPHGNDWIHCSVCGKRGINVPADLTNYCPNCGARMEGAK